MKIKYPKAQEKKVEKGAQPQNNLSLIVLLILVFILGVLVEQIGGTGRLFPDTKQGLLDQLLEEVNTEALLYHDSTLPTIYLDIPFDSMLSITEKRDEALSIGILLASDDDYVPATLHMNDEQNLDIDIRLKGDWTDHLDTSKWSFRIHVKENDGAILGMQRFSIQSPAARVYVNEWVFHHLLMQEGILTTRYDFVNIVINGEHKGVYAIEESFAEDLIESQERREGVIFRYNEDLLWTERAYEPNPTENFWLTDGFPVNEMLPFRGSHIAGSPALLQEYEAATNLLDSFQRGELPVEEVLDAELWGRYYALTDLWIAGHGTVWHNYRFYFNPVTGLVEPVAFDALPLHGFYEKDYLAYPFQEQPLFNNPAVQKAYVATLERITDPAYLQALEETFGADVERYDQAMLQEYTRREIPAMLKAPWEALRERADFLRSAINPAQPIRGNYQLVDTAILQLDLANMMLLPVELNKLRWGDESISLDELQCSGTNCDSGLAAVQDSFALSPIETDQNATIVSFQLPLTAFKSTHTLEEEITLYVNLYGGSTTFEIPILTNYVPQGITQGVLPTATLEEALAAHEFLVQLSDHQLAIEQGRWDVNTDLILPAGYSLSIPHGTTLRFGTGINFVVRGRVDMFGTEAEPVTITSQNGAWGGMLILNADNRSTWEYVRIGEMNGISYPGTGITGGITFYQSAVNIRASQIGNNQTEDALNVIRAEFAFEQVEFLNAPSDAFDGDFVHGTVSNCSFHDILGDGVDVSGSRVSVENSYFVALGDKAISAGEHSVVTAANLTIRDVGIGVASKDLSEVTISASSIEAAHVAGLAAYIKKPQYGPASITATDIEIIDSSKLAFCQTESEITLNGENIQSEDFDVDALYKQGVLGN